MWSANIPVSVHLDHCQNVDLVRQAADMPFDSIMVNMPYYGKAEILRLTRELIEYCHARGVASLDA